jgi:shikimate 5-dehydrogenase
MRMTLKRGLIAAAVVVTLGATGTAIAVTNGLAGDDGNEVPITGAERERASAAALAHTGGGRVTDTEKGDEEGAYEVEVTLEGGKQVDVHLDENFTYLSQEGDGADDEAGED